MWVFRQRPPAWSGQLDSHLQVRLYYRDALREVGLLWRHREGQDPADQLRRRQNQESGYFCLQLWSEVSLPIKSIEA